jgi:hypothetical protein
MTEARAAKIANRQEIAAAAFHLFRLRLDRYGKVPGELTLLVDLQELAKSHYYLARFDYDYRDGLEMFHQHSRIPEVEPA